MKLFKRIQVAAVSGMLLAFIAGISLAGVTEDLASGKPLQDVINASLANGMTVENLVEELIAAEEYGRDIICSLFAAKAEKNEVIAACLNNGMDNSDVVTWSYQCGAGKEDVQQGFNMAGQSMWKEKVEENAKEYLYNPPSPSQ